MTISTQDSKVNYQGNGQTKVFQVPFPFLENNQIYVQKKDAQGNLINYTYATDYTVKGAGEENGGSVTLNVAPEQGSTISIYRDVPLTQEVDYRENEIFPAETHEEALDKLTMEVQQIQEQLDRSVKVDRFSDVDPDIIVKEVERVYDSTDNIDIVANNINDVNTVSGNIANVNTVAGNINSVVITATNVKNVNTVAQNKASINVTAANINDIKTVSSIKNDVHTVANNNTNITKVGTNISSVNTAASNMAAIQYAPTAASNAAQSAANAANSATISANSAIWAEGTDAQVAALGGVHSSKGWAEQSTSVNISLTNSPYTTNRILEIPQDIKLELNNGTLTLKAGSKVYVPNGVGKFDVTTKPSDVVLNFGTSSGLYFPIYNPSNNAQSGWYDKTYSGAEAPTLSSTEKYGVWYDTTNNIIKETIDNGSTWTGKFALPFVAVNLTSGSVTSIDQVFNGFGYIGSTMFALPGVKVQAATGRNVDGTCTNHVHTVSSVLTYEAGPWNNATLYFLLWANSCEGQDVRRFTRNKEFSSQATTYSFDENENKWYYSNNSQAWHDSGFSLNIVGKFVIASGKITSFEPYTVDSVVNSNEFYQLKDKAVTTDTAQTISGSKRFTKPSAGMSIELTADTNQQTVPAKTTTRQLGLYRNATYTKGDGYTSWIHAVRGSDGWNGTELYTRRFLEGDSQEILNYVKILITSDGTPISYTKTPPVGVAGEEITTAGWFNSKMQVVSALPAAPNANVFYFIPG